MVRAIFIIVAISFVAASAVISSDGSPISGSTEIDAETAKILAANPLLAYLGQFENKKYYTQKSDFITWDEAHQFCQNLGFELVSFETLEERRFLRPLVGTTHFWTSGIAKWENQGFEATDMRVSWDATAVPLSGELRILSSTTTVYPLCQILTVPAAI